MLGASKLEFAEVKSGAVSKDDRITFWRRVRRELKRDANAATLYYVKGTLKGNHGEVRWNP